MDSPETNHKDPPEHKSGSDMDSPETNHKDPPEHKSGSDMDSPETSHKDPPEHKSGSNLRHFKRTVDSPAISQGKLDSALDTILDTSKNTTEKFTSTFSYLGSNRKRITIIIAVIIVLLGGALIAPNIPSQLQRSAIIKVFNDSDYQAAYDKSQNYINKNPKDIEIIYYSAKAARLIGNFQYANSKIIEVSKNPWHTSQPNFFYDWALALVITDPVAALEKLDTLITEIPDHAAGHLLRGIILAENGDIRRSRDDFLRADEIVRTQTDETNPTEAAVLQLRDYLLKQKIYFIGQTFPTPSFNQDTLSWEEDFGTPNITSEGFINSYDGGEIFLDDEQLPTSAIIALYYVQSLLANGETEDARAALLDVSADNAAQLIKITQAFLLMYEKNYSAAAEEFQAISKNFPKTASFLVNFANSSWLANPSTDNIQEVSAIYKKALGLDDKNTVAQNNLAVMNIILGRYNDAQSLLSNIPTSNNPHSVFNLAVLAAQIGDPQKSLSLLKPLSLKEFKTLDHIKAKAAARLGDYDDAIALLDVISSRDENDLSPVLLRVHYLIEQELWMRARETLLMLLRRVDSDTRPALKARTHYYMALVAAQVGEKRTGKKQLDEIKKADGDSYYIDALAAEEHAKKQDAQGIAEALKAALRKTSSIMEKTEYASRYGYLLANLDEDLALLSLSELLEQPRLTSRPTIRALLARLQAKQDTSLASSLLYQLHPPPTSSALHNTGLAMMLTGNLEGALENLHAAQQFSPTSIPVLESIKSLYEDLGDNEKKALVLNVIEYLEKIARGEKIKDKVVFEIIFPADKVLREKINQALDSRTQEKREEALDAYSNAIDKTTDDTKHASLLYARSTFFTWIKRYDEAIVDMNAALELNKFNPKQEIRARMAYGHLLFLHGKYKEAGLQFKENIKHFPESPLPHRFYAESLFKIGQQVQANQEIEAVLEKFPADIDSYILLADMQKFLGQPKQAVESLRQAARISPTIRIIYERLNNIQTSLGFSVASENRSITRALRRN